MIIYYTDGTSEILDLSNIITNPNEKAVLVYSKLPDGTYGVMAGGMAKYEAVIDIPSSYNDIAVTQILGGGFADLISLQKVNLPESIKTIGTNAFQNCVGLNSVKLPSNLERIEQYAFNGCSSLTTVSIPSTVNFIGKYSFYASGLTTVSLGQKTGWSLVQSIKLSFDRILQSLDGSSSYSGAYIYTYSYSLSDATALQALTRKVTLRLDTKYTGTGYGSGQTETTYNESAELYKSDWTRN